MENHKNISNLERPRIKMERRTGHNYSYYIDANGLLKGEWGGFKNDYGKGENGEQIFGVFYKSNYIPINEFGYFYNKFDCREFDVVYKFTEGFYICIKNNLFGIIDNDGYCILPANYKNVQAYNLSCWICIVTTDTGKFIYNVSTKETSKEYEDIIYSSLKDDYSNYENYLFYKLKNKFGILNVNGNIILPAKYECIKYPFEMKLGCWFNSYKYDVFIKNGLLYGVIPIDKYDKCFRVGTKRRCFYITELYGKYGLLSEKIKTIVEPCFDDIILYKGYDKSGYHYISTCDRRNKKWVDIVFAIARKENKYWLYNALTGKCYLENCDNISFHDGYSYDKYSYDYRKKHPYVEFDINEVHGYIMSGGVTLTSEEFGFIDIDKNDIVVMKDNKKGLLNKDGYELLPCIYDDIQRKECNSYLVIKEGIQEVLDLHTPSRNKFNIYESHHYGRYSGSYVQDEMGYSDEDIDTIFDGDPTAYWNID